MENGYKEKFYSKYISTHNLNLYGERDFNYLKSQFPSWQKYFSVFLPENKEAKIIDLGCGEGALINWLQDLGFKNAEGIDVSSEQIELGRKFGIKNLKEANILEFIRDKGNLYDLIFLRDVLGHFDKEGVLLVLDSVFKSLRAGGVLIVKTPNAESPLSGRLRYGDFTHDVSFTGSSLKQVLMVCGFKNIRIYPMRPVVHGLISFIRYVLWFCIEFKIKLYRLIEAGGSAGFYTQNIFAAAEKK
ncbi:MAG: class I SAM-dependent methyltransferase [Patescibacteria group bacterium]